MFGPILWAGLIGLLILVMQGSRASADPGPGQARSAALQQLEWRYAAGEITREQYEEMRQVLEQERVPS